MDMRAEVWSPLQNAAVWLGAWLHGHESTDALIDAFSQLGGKPLGGADRTFTDILSTIRSKTTPLLGRGVGEPIIRLILSGPGDAPLLPAASEASRRAAQNPAGAILLRTNDPHEFLVLLPQGEDGNTVWELLAVEGPLPTPAWLSPGDADELLSRATEESAALIAATPYLPKDLPNPRLMVGSLTDFYDTPGLPGAVPPRAAKLFARADRVAAIIETVTDRMGDHSLDPQLLRLWRYIRQARMAGVAYSSSEFAR